MNSVIDTLIFLNFVSHYTTEIERTLSTPFDTTQKKIMLLKAIGDFEYAVKGRFPEKIKQIKPDIIKLRKEIVSA